MHAKVIPQADLVLALDVSDLEGAVTQRAQEKGRRRPVELLSSSTKIINVGLDDLLVRAWSTDFIKLRQADLMIMADTAVFLPELVRRLKSEKERLSKLGEDIHSRRAQWAKLYEEKVAAREKENKTKSDEKDIARSGRYVELDGGTQNEAW